MKDTIFVETCQFDEFGGWVLDQQFITEMFNPYLLAHGMGIPVEDARTNIEVDELGEYHLWARTKNWAGVWNQQIEPTICPGRFQISFDNQLVPYVFGTQDHHWAWEYAGKIEITTHQVNLKLHDLTGFNGRCDGIVLSKNAKLTLPDTLISFNTFRDLYGKKSIVSLKEYDFVVVGGGVAGICAAVASARKGLKVALIHDRNILGGNNSSEVRVQLGGKVNLPPFEAIGAVVNEIDHHTNRNARPAEEYRDDLKMKIIEEEENVDLYLNTYVDEVVLNNSEIKSVKARNLRTGEKFEFSAPLFADCSGDAVLGFLAGADFKVGRESFAETNESIAPESADNMTLGTSVMWYSDEEETEQAFPITPWALQFNDDTCQKAKKGDWDWETGIGRDHIDEFEYIRDYSLMAIFGNWAYLKNFSFLKEEYKKRKLSWVAYIGGKRESRRLVGGKMVNQNDIDHKIKYEDGCVTTSWSIDLHEPKIIEGFEHEPFRARAKKARIEPFTIPYRAFYSKNIDNLFMAGRNISVTHVALGAVRVMKTTGMMGEVVGIAASLCKERKASPSGLYKSHLEELMHQLSIGVPPKGI